ncbi:MAG TPA: Gldg family protein, partial [Armatimonadota bacterium]|nr:Gldg family protein [Armatimonadota bacterium]
MSREAPRKVLFLTGHGEPEVREGAAAPDQLKSIQFVLNDLKDVNTPVEAVSLFGKDAKTPDPSEVAALVIIGPERELADEEARRVNEYLNKGGHVLLALNTRGPSFSKFLAPWGIKTGDDIVLDRTQEGLVVVQADQSSPEAVRMARRVIFQPLRSVTGATPAPGGVTVTELLKSGPNSEVVANYVPGKPVDLRASKPGPIAIAAMAEKKLGTGDDAKTARLVVLGDSMFMADQFARIPAFYNRDLASGLINYLAQEEALVTIAPKDENTEQAFLLPEQGRLLTLIHLADFPLLALLLAVVVYLKRR